MIFRLIIISLFFLSGCVTAEDDRPFNIKVTEIKNPTQRALLYKLQNITNKPLTIDISTFGINEIDFKFYKDKNIPLNLKKFVPIEDYMKKTITIKPNAFYEKEIALSSFYPGLNEHQKSKLKLKWFSQVITYKGEKGHYSPEKTEVSGEILLTTD